MNDTSKDIAALVHDRLMAKSGAERFLMGVRMHEAPAAWYWPPSHPTSAPPSAAASCVSGFMVIPTHASLAMTSEMRQVLAKQPFEQKLLQVSQLVATAQALRAARSHQKGDYVKERDALFAGETVNSLFEQASVYQAK
jgi:hypothetical protein